MGEATPTWVFVAVEEVRSHHQISLLCHLVGLKLQVLEIVPTSVCSRTKRGTLVGSSPDRRLALHQWSLQYSLTA